MGSALGCGGDAGGSAGSDEGVAADARDGDSLGFMAPMTLEAVCMEICQRAIISR